MATQNNGGRAFDGRDIPHGFELWVSDGMQAGARLKTYIGLGGGLASPRSFMRLGADLYFYARKEAFLRLANWRIESGSTEPQRIIDLVSSEDLASTGIQTNTGFLRY